MKNMIWTVGLWLLGIAPVVALDVNVPETLRYDVYWGPVAVGRAQLDYVPAKGKAYMLKAEVQDDSALINLHDVWRSEGGHEANRLFAPAVYHVVQAENAYRSDKTMTFDKAKQRVVYVNHLDASDAAEPLPLSAARDVLATVYAWRAMGREEVLRAAEVPLVSLKREIVLRRQAGVKVTLKLSGKDVTAWKVDMRAIKNGKPAKDLWTVYVSDDARMVPLQIVAATKFGTFRAVVR